MKKYLLIILTFFFLSSGAKAEDKTFAIEKIVDRWNDLHNTGMVSGFRDLYNYTVLFYGKNISREQCVNIKKTFLQNQYSQQIISPIRINYYASGIIQCFFTMEINAGTTIKKDDYYLLLEKRRNNYVITGESDLITDQNLHFQLNLGQEIGPASGNKTVLIMSIAGIFIIATGLFAFRKRKIENGFRPIAAVTAVEIPTMKNQKEKSPFEKFVTERFDQANFEILDWQKDQTHEGRFPKSNGHPDLEIRFSHDNHNIEFAVECKWRKIFYDDTILWAKPHQWDTYNVFEDTTGNPVFVVIGIGGDPGSPENVFVLPLKKINSTQFTISQLQQYKKPGKENFFFDLEKRTLR